LKDGGDCTFGFAMISRKLRLYNFLIDSLVYLGIVFALMVPLKFYFDERVLKWVMIGVYYVYYFLMETINGQTVGKMITKTRVVDSNDRSVSFGGIFFRTMMRIIPFDFISYLFSPQGIHDYLSNTKLIKC